MRNLVSAPPAPARELDTPEEMSASYEALYPPDGTAQDELSDDTDADAKVVKLVRRKKAQDTYQGWLESLQHRYDVEINAVAWEKIIDS